MSIVRYPLQMINGSFVLSKDVGAELDLLLDYPPNRRILDKEYGIDIGIFVQASMNLTHLTPLLLVEIKSKLIKFIRHATLVSARVYKRPSQPRTIYLDIKYRGSNTDLVKTLELKTS